MKHKKFSSAILCGYEMVDGRQHFGNYADDNDKPTAVCVLGAAALCETGYPAEGSRSLNYRNRQLAFIKAFREAWSGCNPAVLNDDEALPWEHIYGMARAAGL